MIKEQKQNQMNLEQKQGVSENQTQSCDPETLSQNSGQLGIDWNLIKSDYLSGLGPQFLSERYNIPLETVRSRIKRENWKDEKEAISQEVRLRFRDMYSETLLEIQVITRENYRKIYSRLREKIIQMMERTNDSRELVLITKSMCDCMNNEFRCVGITELSDKGLYNAINPQPVELSKVEQMITHYTKKDVIEFIKIIIKEWPLIKAEFGIKDKNMSI